MKNKWEGIVAGVEPKMNEKTLWTESELMLAMVQESRREYFRASVRSLYPQEYMEPACQFGLNTSEGCRKLMKGEQFGGPGVRAPRQRAGSTCGIEPSDSVAILIPNRGEDAGIPSLCGVITVAQYYSTGDSTSSRNP